MYDDFIEMLNNLPPQISGASMAIFIAILRVLYDGKETRPIRIILEATICGGLSLCVGSAIYALGMNVNWILFIGGVIGYLGPVSIRIFALRFIRSKVEKI